MADAVSLNLPALSLDAMNNLSSANDVVDHGDSSCQPMPMDFDTQQQQQQQQQQWNNMNAQMYTNVNMNLDLNQLPPQLQQQYQQQYQQQFYQYQQQQQQGLELGLSEGKRRVRFDSSAANTKTHGVCGARVLGHVRNCANMPKEERSQIWFRHSEIKSFKRYAKRQVTARLKGKPWTNEWDDTLRGLEIYFPDRERAHRHNMKHILNVCREHKGNADLIAREAQKFSAESANIAMLSGTHDAGEAFNSGGTSIAKAIESATNAQLCAAQRRSSPAQAPSQPERRA
eukprot:CAMPEP_0198114398 /NCGR_PEP_ID=MMETSP1442-20131203/5800_1 /TAXON_ID= /ORGANISM="Craspedostauros australis, Strain CCMP3328" /LENGTH=285 /DNA_ID=CAMNT_0043771703 /DNA_START=150 /DNA_END=1007 /DNA_ORIENTATION=+